MCPPTRVSLRHLRRPLALIEPTLAAWRKARLDRQPTGKPAPADLREIFNAIAYLNRTGIAWKYLPHDFPPHGTFYAYYAAWRDEGIFDQLNYNLTELARVKEGRKPEPTAGIIDTQSVKTSTNVPLTTPLIRPSPRGWTPFNLCSLRR
jgi:transposase